MAELEIDFVPEEITGYDERLAAKYDTNEALAAMGAEEFPNWMWVEPRDYKEVAERNDEFKTWAKDYWSHFTHQGSSHECVCHSGVQVFEMCYNKFRAEVDDESTVWLSPLSIYNRCNPSIRGGTYLSRFRQFAMDEGILPENNGPTGTDDQKERFDHTLHQTAGRRDDGGGPWVSVRNMPQGWKETAKNFRILSFINLTSTRQIYSALLNGYAVHVGRSGHAIPYYKVAWQNNRIIVPYSDSYNVERADSESMVSRAVGGAYTISLTTAPDEWESPEDD